MKEMYLDENGNVIDFLEERNKCIIESLSPTLDDFLKEKQAMLKLKKPVKLGYQFTKQLYMVLARFGRLSAEKVAEMDYETLNDYWLKYLELTAYYNKYFEIVDNKQLFMAFMGINSRIYSQWEKSDDEDIRNLMLEINGAFVGLGFMATESGNADSKAVKTRLEAKGVGHNVVSAVEDMAVNALSGQKSENELQKELEAILGSPTKKYLK